MNNNELIPTNKIIEVVKVLRDTVRHGESELFKDDSGEYDVVDLSLAVPRKIGKETAHRLRIALARSGELAVAATYLESNVKSKDTNRVGWPLRHISFGAEAEPVVYFDGRMDARPYPLSVSYAVELLADVEASVK